MRWCDKFDCLPDPDTDAVSTLFADELIEARCEATGDIGNQNTSSDEGREHKDNQEDRQKGSGCTLLSEYGQPPSSNSVPASANIAV